MAPRPLPKGKQEVPWQEKGHAGLWYEKLGGTWQEGWSLQAGEGGSPKLEWMQPLLREQGVGSKELLKEHADRRGEMARRLGGRILELENRSAFVSGLGQAHPIENGFLWHPCLGVPYLPGSGVKGVLRSWLRMEGPQLAAAVAEGGAGAGSAGDAEIDRLLGGADHVGAIDLLPLLPTRPVRLQADLVNPHHGPYQRGDEWPADWQDPVPSFFLAVAPRALWQLSIVPGTGAREGDVERAAAWLSQAADWIGFGAKTAVGYGRFR